MSKCPFGTDFDIDGVGSRERGRTAARGGKIERWQIQR